MAVSVVEAVTVRSVSKYGALLMLSSAGLMTFLGNWEGQKNQVYADKLAKNIPTVCKGITRHVSPYPVVLGEWWSDEKCAEVEAVVTERTQLKLLDCFKVKITQPQFDAFTSHAHNFGVSATCSSRAMALTNAGKPVDGCRALSHSPNGAPVWSYTKNASGVPVFVKGLYNRRKAETALCLKGTS